MLKMAFKAKILHKPAEGGFSRAVSCWDSIQTAKALGLQVYSNGRAELARLAAMLTRQGKESDNIIEGITVDLTEPLDEQGWALMKMAVRELVETFVRIHEMAELRQSGKPLPEKIEVSRAWFDKVNDYAAAYIKEHGIPEEYKIEIPAE